MALVAAGLGVPIAPASIGALRIRGAVGKPLPTTAGRAVLYSCYDDAAGRTDVRTLTTFLRRVVAGATR